MNRKNSIIQINDTVILETKQELNLKLQRSSIYSSGYQSNNSQQQLQQQLQQQQQQSADKLLKKRMANNKSRENLLSDNTNTINNNYNNENESKGRILPSNYCISINMDGARNMDRVSHLTSEQIENKSLEYKLRPISGLRNHIKRNLISGQSADFDVFRDTDLVQRIGSVKTLKRLDLSNNNLQTYPRQLCELSLLETLNLCGNSLNETDFPLEIEKYQNLIELILDYNQFKRLPKCVSRLKKLSRLSIRNNSLVDLKYFEYLKKLRFLILDNNLLTSIGDNIKTLEKLEILGLRHNLINSFDSKLLKSSLNYLKQLDLSFNKLNTVSTELFMLPHLEILNLSNNSISKLPVIPLSYFRTVPIFSLDLSSNDLVTFYDYLLILSRNVDVSSNKIKKIPSKALDKLSLTQLNSRNLKLDNNPLVEPPIEICNYGLKVIKEYFDEVARNIQLNKGFKIMLFGDNLSGKTALAYALEDYNCQTNMIEQFLVSNNNSEDESNESKFVEIHEFLLKNDKVEEVNSRKGGYDYNDDYSNEFFVSLRSDLKSVSSFNASSTRITSSSGHQTSKVKKSKKSELLNQIAPPTTTTNADLVTTSNNNNNNNNKLLSRITGMPVTIYDFNGCINQYGSLMDHFIDKSALVIICVDGTQISLAKDSLNSNKKAEDYLHNLLDLIILKMNKLTTFYLLPVLTKSDKIIVPSSLLSSSIDQQQEETNTTKKPTDSNETYLKLLASHVQNLIKNHIESKLNDIKTELKKIELLPQISASQSDRLKQLIQTKTNINPEIHKECHVVSSINMNGIESLSKSIREVVCKNKKYFPEVNTKIPIFWIEVEKYACNVLSELPTPKMIDDNLRIVNTSNKSKISVLCVDYDDYKEKITEKYGMAHLVEQITKYMNSSGKAIWFHDSEKLKKKRNFHENFQDSHLHGLRIKLVKNTINTSDENIVRMQNNLLTKGELSLDLLKLLWYPILLTDSPDLILETILLFSIYFHIGYPDMPKEKLKILYFSILNFKSDSDKFELNNNDSLQTIQDKFSLIEFNTIILPFYLPKLDDESKLVEIRQYLMSECTSAAYHAVDVGLKTDRSRLSSRLSQKYVFPWGLMPGIFEKFTTNCILNSDLYYKMHLKDFVYGYNEDNSIGVLMYVNTSNGKHHEVIFEFYLVSYESILESLGTNKSKEPNFQQTLSMDLDHIWMLALRVLQLFEETISLSYPSLIYDRYSLCPECENYSFFGEWVTPKELQKHKSKVCNQCSRTIDYSFLVKPTIGQNLSLDLKKLQQRLENLTKIHTTSKSTFPSNITSQLSPIPKSEHSAQTNNDIHKLKSKSKVYS